MAWKVEERKYEITEVISFLSYVLLCGKENISDEEYEFLEHLSGLVSGDIKKPCEAYDTDCKKCRCYHGEKKEN